MVSETATAGTSHRATRDGRMSLLSGHHRIMGAAEAALVMMVLEEGGGSLWAIIGVASPGDNVELVMI